MLYVLLLNSKVQAEMRLVFCVINRDSILSEPERDRVRPGFEIFGAVIHKPLLCAPARKLYVVHSVTNRRYLAIFRIGVCFDVFLTTSGVA